jgi:hypothetical protein
MPIDVWNISSNGHFELVGDEQSSVDSESKIFKLYEGKTIVLLGNSFPYFEARQRMATDLIDHDQLAIAAQAGTSVFVSGTHLNETGIQRLVGHLRARSAYPRCKTFKTAKLLLKAIYTEYTTASFHDIKFHCTPTSRHDNAQRCAQKAKRIAEELHRRLPNVRFVVSWTSSGLPQSLAGEVVVLPCTAYDAAKFVIISSISNESPETKTFGLLLLRPFSMRLEMLWKHWGEMARITESDIMADTIEYEMIVQLARFVHANPPWPDCFGQQDILRHLRRLFSLLIHFTSSLDPR